MKRSGKLVSTALVCLLAIPTAAWTFFKPIRILVPELNGVDCTGLVCVEQPSTLPRAQKLHAEALSNISTKLRRLHSPPVTVFCSSRACYASFGGGLERGAAILDLGVIIPPESWQTYIVEHELIHMLQAQELGLLGRERTPAWFKEGMPFLISAPPKFDLPKYAAPLAAQYQAWEKRVGRENVWEAIRKH